MYIFLPRKEMIFLFCTALSCFVFTQDHLYQPKPHLSHKDVDEMLRHLSLLTCYVVKLAGYQTNEFNYILWLTLHELEYDENESLILFYTI